MLVDDLLKQSNLTRDFVLGWPCTEFIATIGRREGTIWVNGDNDLYLIAKQIIYPMKTGFVPFDLKGALSKDIAEDPSKLGKVNGFRLDNFFMNLIRERNNPVDVIRIEDTIYLMEPLMEKEVVTGYKLIASYRRI